MLPHTSRHIITREQILENIGAIKETLPDVSVKLKDPFHKKSASVVTGKICGRLNRYATVTVPSGQSWEWEWGAIERALRLDNELVCYVDC